MRATREGCTERFGDENCWPEGEDCPEMVFPLSLVVSGSLSSNTEMLRPIDLMLSQGLGRVYFEEATDLSALWSAT